MKLKVFWFGIMFSVLPFESALHLYASYCFTRTGSTFLTSFYKTCSYKTFFFFLIPQNEQGHFPHMLVLQAHSSFFFSWFQLHSLKTYENLLFLLFSSCFSISTATNYFVDSFDLVINKMFSFLSTRNMKCCSVILIHVNIIGIEKCKDKIQLCSSLFFRLPRKKREQNIYSCRLFFRNKQTPEHHLQE